MHLLKYLPGLALIAAATLLSPPATGSKAPDFTLTSLQGKTVRLSEETSKHAVVLVVLRGFPGYQCPVCNRQVRDFITNASGFLDAVAKVLIAAQPRLRIH